MCVCVLCITLIQLNIHLFIRHLYFLYVLVITKYRKQEEAKTENCIFECAFTKKNVHFYQLKREERDRVAHMNFF